jgi:DNA-binding response OmpR family regulator
MKFLIVEDDHENAKLIPTGLGAGGHAASLATNGREGFEPAVAETFDASSSSNDARPRRSCLRRAAPL